MKRLALALLLPILTAAPAVHAESKEATLQFPAYEFEIAPLEVETEKAITAVQMFMPPYGGFAANVSVRIEPWKGNMGGYVAGAKAQIEQNGWTLISEEARSDGPVFEYSGKSGRQELHWYGRSLMRKGKMYVITATTLESRWETDKDALIEVVETFTFSDKD
ncbi:photosystem II reaction center PsbP family protein [bacterium]|nr:photosystem II reaction center PsbP family protein [bacterium]